MLTRMSATPSVMKVKHGTGASLISRTPSKQAQLPALRFGEMIDRQLGAALVQSKLLAGDLEPTSDHPGHRAGAFHSRAPLRIVVAPSPHVADQGEYMAITIRIIRHQPFAEEVAHLQ